MLRNAIVGSIQDLPREFDPIANLREGFDYFIEEGAMFPHRKTLDVLEYKIGCLQFVYDADKLSNKRVAWIVECSVTNEGKSLARSATEDYIDPFASNSGDPAEILTGHGCNRTRNDCALGKIELVDRCVNRIDFDRRHDIESGLLEAKTQPASTSKQIDTNRSKQELPPITNL